MSRLVETIEIEYPESDGQPMAETDLHREWMFRVIHLLQYRYRNDPNAYVSGDLLVYYVEGDPRKRVAPDAFVAVGCPSHRRRVFKVWEENAPPTVAIEVTSSSTRRRDEVEKPAIYAEIGVREYFLYDPTSDYLSPPLKGFRRDGDGDGFVPIEPDAEGRLECRELGFTLQLDESNGLVVTDIETGEEQVTEADAERTAREAGDAALAAERRARAEAEAEIARLRAMLNESGHANADETPGEGSS